MKLIIAGGRDYYFSADDYLELEHILSDHELTEVVSGGAKGADLCGEIWGKNSNLKVTQFKADWLKHGRAAGPKRNKEMAEYADAVALFSGGRGTDSMYREAKKAGLEIFDFRRAGI